MVYECVIFGMLLFENGSFLGVNVPMEFVFWLVKVLFVFKFFMGFVHSEIGRAHV